MVPQRDEEILQDVHGLLVRIKKARAMRRLDMEVGEKLCHPYDEDIGIITAVKDDHYVVKFETPAQWIDGPTVDFVFFSDLED